MSYRTYYKLSSFILVLVSFVLVLLILQPFLEAKNDLQQIKSSDLNNAKFQDDLRMHRDLYLQVYNSENPAIANNTKEKCKEGLNEIDSALYTQNLNPEQEMTLRKRLNQINSQISQTLNIDYYMDKSAETNM